MRLLTTIKFLRKTASYTTKYRILKVTCCSWKEPDAQDQSIHHIITLVSYIYPGNIRVYCRVRPFLPGQVSSSSTIAGMEERTITIITPTKYGKYGTKSFTFNKCFGPTSTQGKNCSIVYLSHRSWWDLMTGLHGCFFIMQMRFFQIWNHWSVQFLMVSTSAYLHMAKLDLGRPIRW